MSIVGYIADFSLPEIFHWAEKGRKSGLLMLRPLGNTQRAEESVYYVWIFQGQIVAVANRLDYQGLVSIIQKYQWVSDRVMGKVVQCCCPINKPLGLCLKNNGILEGKQLKQLFQIQVIKQIYALFQIEEAEFKFDQKVPIPGQEMTGLSISATGATLMGLRSRKNWATLADKLPDPDGSIVGTITEEPSYHLTPLEWQIWEYTKVTISLNTIAKELRLPIGKVQEIAYLFIAVGLAEEVPLLASNLPSQAINLVPTDLTEESPKEKIGTSFVQNLVGFLRSHKSPQLSITTLN
ncbi:MAG TPA: hypothetical protein DEG17_07430 [Cyanobacteria bacterium UBA11149]|nr:hypothetical protein [Cyanobacteria bacterium UBA11367]HBE56282.1 hypothetical protein [Cyanobacteria bacterium UBA11366]HBK65062.1 hypothetical protein [Cyanobacteria bacterium UBA11166]HBR75987.1 hypothetical protein [Cyanobacteria bacterium UBA11159]HBS72612.1 hypothetical protein [Cyanobacteria bacterium UBA11153]HBW88695.1 hypothetical protein [Cyanobacteria bacterium UBA11149]HCA96768.1 hypothetical protein [Cyanobacteria bacterium UBA9226]